LVEKRGLLERLDAFAKKKIGRRHLLKKRGRIVKMHGARKDRLSKGAVPEILERDAPSPKLGATIYMWRVGLHRVVLSPSDHRIHVGGRHLELSRPWADQKTIKRTFR